MIEEDALVAALSKILLSDQDIDGLDEDLVSYISGMVATKLSEDELDGAGDVEEALDEVMIPFLESVACPDDLCQEAKQAVLGLLASAEPATTSNQPLRKLRQGVVSMSDDLKQSDDQANRMLWGTDKGVKPAANKIIEAHQDKSSAKDRRKRRQELEISRKAFEREDQEEAPSGLVAMSFTRTDQTSSGKAKDVQLRNVHLSLDNGTLLMEGGELKFAYQRRYGLIGENGVGKTTLLKAIAKKGDGIEGFPNHLRVLHVRQEVPKLTDDISVIQAVLDADIERKMLLQEEKELLAKLEQKQPKPTDDDTVTTADSSTISSIDAKREKLKKGVAADGDSNSEFADDLKKLDDVYQRLQGLNSDSAEARAAMILSGLQFAPEKQVAPISSLSGGWQMRVALAAALFVEPDICLLDEPTNHLDLEAVLWLEQYLQTYQHTLVVVSHDRGFLNEVCTDVIEFKRKKLTYYRGNYDTFVKLRDANIRNAMRVYQAYKEKRDHMMEFIEKFRANAKRATMVQSRIKTVEKMDAEAPEPVEIDPVWRFSIPNANPLGRPIISVDDVSFDYTTTRKDGSKKPESEWLLQTVNFGVDLTSKIAVLGANGQGKTTLFNLIMGKLKPMKGNISVNPGLRIGHFTQHSSDNFDLMLSATENLLNMFPEVDDEQVMRSFLGKFQIQGIDAVKPMKLLSGGQKSRVAFAALAYKKPHVLVIDEGSNHLSMEAVDALVEAIQDFKGGLLVVSHDQYFVSKTCNELWVIEEGKANRFRGDFDEYKKHTAAATHKRVEESVKRMNAMNSNNS